MSVEDYTETGNYLSMTRLVLSVLPVTIVAERHIQETALFFKRCFTPKEELQRTNNIPKGKLVFGVVRFQANY